MSRILLVDDEETLRISLSFTLSKEGYEVSTAADGVSGLREVQENPPDLVILDLMLPGMSGTEVCRWIRRFSEVPILMLTAKGEVEDKVAGLSMGADDYLTKPFNHRELAARIQALLRRHRKSVPTSEPAPRRFGALALVQSGIIEAGPLRMDLDRHQVISHGKPLDLPPKEFQLLHTLLSHRGRVLPREALLASVWGDDFAGDPRTLDVHIRWLRSKIEEDPGEPSHIVTVRGIGFRFDEEGEGEAGAP